MLPSEKISDSEPALLAHWNGTDKWREQKVICLILYTDTGNLGPI